jgi:hypothetical protein
LLVIVDSIRLDMMIELREKKCNILLLFGLTSYSRRQLGGANRMQVVIRTILMKKSIILSTELIFIH